MSRMLVVALTLAALFAAACGQEPPVVPAQPKPEAKPATDSVAPAPPATPPAPTPAAAPEPVKTPAATPETAVPPKAPEPVQPATPPAAKPAVKVPEAPELLTIAASQGDVTLPHLVHAKLFPCATCHGDGTPGKIALDKDAAHALCRDCHKARGAGPTACGGCHKK